MAMQLRGNCAVGNFLHGTKHHNSSKPCTHGLARKVAYPHLYHPTYIYQRLRYSDKHIVVLPIHGVMKKTKPTFLVLLFSISLSIYGQTKVLFPLKERKLVKGDWVLCLSETEKIRNGVEDVGFIDDEALLMANRDSLWIIPSSDYLDCASKTEAFRLFLYHNHKKVGTYSYCYPGQVSFGSLSNHFIHAKQIKETVTKKELKATRENILQQTNCKLIYTVRLKDKRMWLVAYLRFNGTE
jgi:hypothetical protein